MVLVVLAALGITYALGQRPTAVFDDMLSNNFSTSGYTRVMQQSSNGLNLSQYTQVSFGQHPTAHALTTFKQSNGIVATEEISDQTSDFVRYQKISPAPKGNDGKPIDTAKVVGKWAKVERGNNLDGTSAAGLFEQSLLGILPIANLQPEKRTELLRYIKDNDIFNFDPSKVTTTTVNGRRAYQYAVTVKAAPYIVLMQNFGRLLGMNQYAGVDPDTYSQSAGIEITIKVDTRSHTLIGLDEAASGRSETYQAFGAVTTTPMPTATLTTKELTDQLGTL